MYISKEYLEGSMKYRFVLSSSLFLSVYLSHSVSLFLCFCMAVHGFCCLSLFFFFVSLSSLCYLPVSMSLFLSLLSSSPLSSLFYLPLSISNSLSKIAVFCHSVTLFLFLTFSLSVFFSPSLCLYFSHLLSICLSFSLSTFSP